MGTKYLILILLLLLNKSGHCQNNNNNDVSFFGFGSFEKDTMYIRTTFVECGEWGGNFEVIKIYMVGDNCYAVFEKYLADCSSVKLNDGKPIQKLITKIVRPIGRVEQLLVRQYLHSLLDLKFSETDFGHAFIVSDLTFRSEINLRVYSWSDQVEFNYNNLKSVLTN
jgi:hypothetical protein